jgi:hypothetical protein
MRVYLCKYIGFTGIFDGFKEQNAEWKDSLLTAANTANTQRSQRWDR